MPNIFLGFDIGATNIRAVRVRGSRAEQFSKSSRPLLKRKLAAAIQKNIRTLTRSGESVSVGIGIAGNIQGTLLKSNRNAQIKNFDLRAVVSLRQRLVVDNDARAFAVGEFKKGAGRGAKRMLAITLGTGIGRALIVSGSLRKIKSLERAQSFEKEYQRARDRAKDKKLAALIVHGLRPLIKRVRPDRVVVGGGVAFDGGSRFWKTFSKEFQEKMSTISLRRAQLGEWAGAWGMIFELKSRAR